MHASNHDYALLRDQGRRDAESGTSEHAPPRPLSRVAWAAGRGKDELRDAIRAARDDQASWEEIAEAVGSATAEAVAAEFG
jgi:hypothetical protein